MEEPKLFSVGYHKGEMDFGVNGNVADLSYEQMKELREMIVVGIGVMESMWRGGGIRREQMPSTNLSTKTLP